MFHSFQNKLKTIFSKIKLVAGAYGRNRDGQFSFLLFLFYFTSPKGFVQLIKYSINFLTLLFKYDFPLLRKLVYRNLSELHLISYPIPNPLHINPNSITFTELENPKVSIIIPVYNKVEYTFNCLKSIHEFVKGVTFEVIIVSDCSTDRTKELMTQIQGVIYLENASNSGFVISCNYGATKAKGEYLCFLNNDTIVQENWLESLVNTIESDNTVGLTGSQFIFPDGDLQEAGGIVWNDGATFSYGRKDDPRNVEYNFAREVNYCTGASILLRKTDFDLYPFDTLFAPGYYEDVDLCFSIHYLLNKKIIYQPLSKVVHFEGISAGTSTTGGMKQYQILNAIKFKHKWETQLANLKPNSFLNVSFALKSYHYS